MCNVVHFLLAPVTGYGTLDSITEWILDESALLDVTVPTAGPPCCPGVSRHPPHPPPPALVTGHVGDDSNCQIGKWLGTPWMSQHFDRSADTS